MSDLITTGTSGYATGDIDSATVLVSNVSPISAKHPNGLAAAIVQLETVLGSGTSLKGAAPDLVTRLANAISAVGTIKLDGFLGLTTDRGVMASSSTTLATSNHTPIGSEMMWCTDTPPAQWLLEDGQAVSRLTYAKLFAVIGTTFGVGNGTTTFNLDDARGRFIVGKDFGTLRTTAATAVGVHGGSETIDTTQLPAHHHQEQGSNSSGSPVPARRQDTSGVATVSALQIVTDTSASDSGPLNTADTGNGVAYNQPFTVRNLIIFAGV